MRKSPGGRGREGGREERGERIRSMTKKKSIGGGGGGAVVAVTSWMHGLPHSLSVAEEGTAGEEEKKWMMMARGAAR